MANILWEYDQSAVRVPIVIDPLEQLQQSVEYEVSISHDSAKSITECGFYISPFTGDYKGTHSPQKDYERVLWLANNYPNFGLSIRQEYLATGEVDNYSTVRLIDLARLENTDIFTGETLEITSGPENGNTQVVSSYDPIRKLFILDGAYFNDVTGETYQIQIDKTTLFKSQQGSSFSYPIPLVYGGGVLARFEKTSFKVKMSIPKFAVSAGSFYFDLNLRYTSTDGAL